MNQVLSDTPRCSWQTSHMQSSLRNCTAFPWISYTGKQESLLSSEQWGGAVLLAASAPCCGLKDSLKNTSNAPALLTLSELTISRQHLQDMFCLCANPCHLLPALDWCPASFSEDAVGCSQQVTLPKTFMITSFSSIVLSLLRIPAFLWSLPMAALPSPPLLQSSLLLL